MSAVLTVPPPAATRADLGLAFGSWSMTYQLPMGQTREKVDERAMELAVGKRPHVDDVVDLVEEHLRSAGRDPVRMTQNIPVTVVAAWALAPVARAAD
jgi:hypothetical protein